MPLPNPLITPVQLENESETTKTLTITENYANSRLDVALGAIIPEISRTRITNWIKQGKVYVDDQILPAKHKVMGGEKVIIKACFEEPNLSFIPEDIKLNIIYEDEHLLVVNKVAGMVVHPGNGNWGGTLLNALIFYCPSLQNIPRAGIVHRLDKDTSGLMVVAKTLLSQTSLVKQLQQREVIRIYRAIVEGQLPKTGTINKNLGRDMRNRIKMTTLEVGGRVAVTRYRVLQYWHNFSYIECKLETGRTHQIRVHLKSIGHPLVGDPTYGSKKINYLDTTAASIRELNRQALHAIKLSFHHPATLELMNFEIPLATDIKNLIASLNSDYLIESNRHKDIEEEYSWEVMYVNE